MLLLWKYSVCMCLYMHVCLIVTLPLFCINLYPVITFFTSDIRILYSQTLLNKFIGSLFVCFEWKYLCHTILASLSWVTVARCKQFCNKNLFCTRKFRTWSTYIVYMMSTGNCLLLWYIVVKRWSVDCKSFICLLCQF